MIELQQTDSFVFTETEDFPILPPTPVHTVDSSRKNESLIESAPPTISISSRHQTQVELTAEQMESLYGHEQEVVISSPKDNNGNSIYPSLQTLLARTDTGSTHVEQGQGIGVQISSSIPNTDGAIVFNRPPAYNVDYVEESGQHFEEVSEHTSLLSQGSDNREQEQTRLLRLENERLQQELDGLRSSMTESGASATSSTGLTRPQTRQGSNHFPSPVILSSMPSQQSILQGSNTAPALNVKQIQERQLQIQQQAQQRSQAPPSSAVARNGNDNAVVKYVCCGSCRQWLSSPRDANFVYCPGCGAVNNCNVKPTEPGSSSSTTPAPPSSVTRAPPRRVGENSPWYLQCIEKLF